MFDNSMKEQYREHFVRESLLSDEFLDFMKRNRIPFETLISYYRCAIMEIISSIYKDGNPIKYEDMPWTVPKINVPLKMPLLGNVTFFDETT